MKLIGQPFAKSRIDKYIESGDIPHFLVFFGWFGTGKKTFAKYISEELGMNFVVPTEKLNTERTRQLVEQAYQCATKTIFLLADMDDLNKNTESVLLKVVEECPSNAYFIMTCKDVRHIGKPLYSRAVTIPFFLYKEEEMVELAKEFGIEYTKEMADNRINAPGQLLNYKRSLESAEELSIFIDKVIDNIPNVSEANMFKIADKIAFDLEDTGFNLRSFWTQFNQHLAERLKDSELPTYTRTMYYEWINKTNKHCQRLSVPSINKKMMFDTWLVELKESVRA